MHDPVEPRVASVGVADGHRVEQDAVQRAAEEHLLDRGSAGRPDAAELAGPLGPGLVPQPGERPAGGLRLEVRARSGGIHEGHPDLRPDHGAPPGAEADPATDRVARDGAVAARNRPPGAARRHGSVEAQQDMDAIAARGAAEPATRHTDGDLVPAREAQSAASGSRETAVRLEEKSPLRARREPEGREAGPVSGREGDGHAAGEPDPVPAGAGSLVGVVESHGRGGGVGGQSTADGQDGDVAEGGTPGTREVERREPPDAVIGRGVARGGPGRRAVHRVGGRVRSPLQHAERACGRGCRVAAEPRGTARGADERVDEAGDRGLGCGRAGARGRRPEGRQHQEHHQDRPRGSHALNVRTR